MPLQTLDYAIDAGERMTQCTGPDCIPNDESVKCDCLRPSFADARCQEECNVLDHCSNGGTLELNLGERQCACTDGFYGRRCELYNPCHKAKCSNGAVCVNVSQTEHVCQCERGFYGDQCRQFNPCSNEPCMHGGSCTNLTESVYTCICFYGHYGKRCESYDPCPSSPCQNKGICTNRSNTEYTCTCTDGYHGETCELYQPCNYSPCLNDGVCNSEDGQFYCDCPRGWFGKRCEHTNLCHQLQPCGKHAEVCHNTSDTTYRCVCELGKLCASILLCKL